MKISVLAFGIAREICGSGNFNLEVPEGSNTSDLREFLCVQFPGLRGLASMAIAVNQEYAPEETALCSGDEIAIIPPVSGG